MSEIHQDLERLEFPTYEGQKEDDPYYAPTTEASTTASDTSTDTSTDGETDTSTQEVPVTDPSEATEAPATEAPATEAPATEAPAA